MTSNWGSGAELDVVSADEDGLSYDLDTYRRLLQRLLADGYEFVGFEGSIESSEVALRHDVDLSLECAVDMARLEASLGVTSTYFVLVTAPAYDLLAPENRRRLRCIRDAGHEIGLHFDPHAYWRSEPSRSELHRRVDADRTALARVLDDDVGVVSIHVPPSWALDEDFDGFESTYQPAYFSDVGYVSDSSQKWRSERPFDDGVPDAMQLLVHPGLWHSEDRPIAAIVEALRDRRVDGLDGYLDDIGG